MLPIYTFARTGYGLYSAYSRTGVIGLGDWAEALVRVVPRMIAYERKKNHDALTAMVSEAKSKVPQDTGRLLNGIGGKVDGDVVYFWAHAVHEEGEADYARFVEFGTAESGVADDRYFEGDGASALGGRHHGATPAEPFFFPSADDQLSKRGVDASDSFPQAARDAGL